MMPADLGGSTTPDRPPRLVRRLVVAVSGLVLLAMVGISPAAWLTSAHSAQPPPAEPRPVPTPDRTLPLGLRPMPVYRADGVVPGTFRPDAGLPSQADLDQAIDQAARSLSITEMPRIRAVLSRAYTDGLGKPGQPFAYPRLDPLVAEALPAALMRSRAPRSTIWPSC
jgi:hypothetical protein